jgi:lipopolysaccharide transport system ATP-binding protein
MKNCSLKAENLSKIYSLGEIGTGTLSRDLDRWYKTKILKREDPFLKIGENNDKAKRSESNIVYTLQDISFEIEQGDAVGIIGRNGAGKSTLLKILSRVTTPTAGRINIKGRIASLLEVGTGFHPELTGRENIYLNGAILGMRKREIDRKLDEIIDFSGVERYIDTPVKRYSSGMYVRLAFAVAAHLESEILIVDEVLAVGDAEFQKKCLGKMGEVSKGEGRTVLFVSHNMASIQSLCNKGILLEKGRLVKNTAIKDVINSYSHLLKAKIHNENRLIHRPLNDQVYCTQIQIKTNNEENIIKSGEAIEFLLHYVAKKFSENDRLEFVLGIWSSSDKDLFMMTNKYYGQDIKITTNQGLVKFQLDKLQLNYGSYYLNILIRKNGIEVDFVENAYFFEVSQNDFFGNGNVYPIAFEGIYTDFKIEHIER